MICSDQASLRKQVNSMATTHAATTSITSNTMHSQQQHWWSAARTLATLCQQLVATLSTAAGAGQVESALRQQLQLFGGATTTAVADPPSNQQQLEQQLCSHAAALGWDVLRGIWYQDQFETWASAVLAGVCLCACQRGMNACAFNTRASHCLHAQCLTPEPTHASLPTLTTQQPNAANHSCSWRVAAQATTPGRPRA